MMLTSIHSFIHSRIYIAPLQGNYSEVLPTPARSKRTVLRANGTENNPLSDERRERLLREPDTGRQRSIRYTSRRAVYRRLRSGSSRLNHNYGLENVFLFFLIDSGLTVKFEGTRLLFAVSAKII